MIDPDEAELTLIQNSYEELTALAHMRVAAFIRDRNRFPQQEELHCALLGLPQLHARIQAKVLAAIETQLEADHDVDSLLPEIDSPDPELGDGGPEA